MTPFLRRVRAIAGKEMQHLLRDQKTLLVVFLQPVMLMLIYGNVLSFDVKRIPFAVWDQEGSGGARQFLNRLTAGDREQLFTPIGYVSGPDEIEPLLASSRARFVLVIPRDFGKELGA